jgi:hypothetical protein
MKHIADTPGFYQGKHYTDYIAQVQALKSAKQLDEAEILLVALIKAVEVENFVERLGVAPWYYEQLAILYHDRKDYAAEIAVVKRYHWQPHHTRMSLFADRLVQARALLRDSVP